MLIAIDHGNKQIKTSRRTFVSGVRESDTKPPFGQNILFYKGKYYTLSDQRIPYMRDKTVDERYFILTLFAVAFELSGADYHTDEVVDVQLAIGLPPAHYGAQYERFEKYFLNRDIIDFEFDGRPYAVMHYLHCSETPDIPQPPIDTNAIEMIVRRIMAEQSSKPIADGQSIPTPEQRSIKSEQINFGDASDLLGEDGMKAIKNTIAAFRKG